MLRKITLYARWSLQERARDFSIEIDSHFVTLILQIKSCVIRIFRQIFLKKLKLDTVHYFPKCVILHLIPQVWNSTPREAKMAILPINKKFHSFTDLSLSNLSKN